MGVSVVIATFRRGELLERTLSSLVTLRRPDLLDEVIVVDNADEDVVRKIVSAASARLPLRLLTEPTPGKNRALNRAVPIARGDLVAFTDDDVIVDPDWLVALSEGSARWPQANVFGGRILPRWPTGGGPTFTHPFFRHAYAIADWDCGEGYYSAGRVFGGNMAIRRSVFAAGWTFAADVGPAGTAEYLPGSETEMTARLERAGSRAVYLPEALVFHGIRPEQLESSWLRARAFRKGRADLYRHPRANTVLIAGVALSIWRDLARAAIMALSCRFADDARRFDRAIAYSYLRGMVHESRRRSRPLQPVLTSELKP
jgi:hypothetical protein